MRTRLALASLVVLALSASAGARNLLSQSGKVSVTIPDAWQVAVLQPDVMVLAGDTNEEIRVLFWVVDAADLGRAVQALGPELEKYVKDIRWGTWAALTINGMAGQGADGTATAVKGGAAVTMSGLVVKTPSGKALIVLGLVKTAARAKHLPAIKGMLTSLRPMK